MEGICTVLGVYERSARAAYPYQLLACCVYDLSVRTRNDRIRCECYLCSAVGLNACESEGRALYLSAAHVGLAYRNSNLCLGIVEHLYAVGAACRNRGAACCDACRLGNDAVLDRECELGLYLLEALGSYCLFESILAVGEILYLLGGCARCPCYGLLVSREVLGLDVRLCEVCNSALGSYERESHLCACELLASADLLLAYLYDSIVEHLGLACYIALVVYCERDSLVVLLIACGSLVLCEGVCACGELGEDSLNVARCERNCCLVLAYLECNVLAALLGCYAAEVDAVR